MKLFDVYPLYNINIVKGKGCKVWDENGTEYLDLYGGHAVISIGHAHPHYVEMISNQVANLGFYSNSVINKLQQQVAERLGKISGYEDYSLFLINSGAEANENALKLASFHNGRTKVVSQQSLPRTYFTGSRSNQQSVYHCTYQQQRSCCLSSSERRRSHKAGTVSGRYMCRYH